MAQWKPRLKCLKAIGYGQVIKCDFFFTVYYLLTNNLAIWMMPMEPSAYGPDPRSGEIDITEVRCKLIFDIFKLS